MEVAATKVWATFRCEACGFQLGRLVDPKQVEHAEVEEYCPRCKEGRIFRHWSKVPNRNVDPPSLADELVERICQLVSVDGQLKAEIRRLVMDYTSEVTARVVASVLASR